MNNNNENAMKNQNKIFTRKGKLSIYTVAMAVILLAVLIVVNLIVASLPTNITVIDTSSNNMYTLSKTTEKFLRELDTPVTIYYLCSGGSENATIRNFLDRFPALTDKIALKVVDPVAEPAFVSKYTDAELSNYSIIVESEIRSKVIDAGELTYYYNEYFGRMTTEELNTYYQYYPNYFSYYKTTEYFDGDNMITGAIEYVKADMVPTLYILEGHGESDFAPLIRQNYIDYVGVKNSALNIAIDGEIPDDCTCLVINAPTSDITSAEAESIKAYIDGGGNVMLITGPGAVEFENLMSITAHLGMSAVAGTVYEGDSSKYYTRKPQYIYPTVSSSHAAVADFVETGYILLSPNSHGIIFDGAEGVTVTELMTTSEKAYAVTESGNGDPHGFILSAAAEKGESRFVWIGSAELATDTFLYGTNGGNFYCFCSMLNWMQEGFKSELPEISAIEMTSNTLTVNESQANMWSNILIFVIPGIVIVGGLAYWIYRRRR